MVAAFGDQNPTFLLAALRQKRATGSRLRLVELEEMVDIALVLRQNVAEATLVSPYDDSCTSAFILQVLTPFITL